MGSKCLSRYSSSRWKVEKLELKNEQPLDRTFTMHVNLGSGYSVKRQVLYVCATPHPSLVRCAEIVTVWYVCALGHCHPGDWILESDCSFLFFLFFTFLLLISNHCDYDH
jgi:hypothetical protein